MFAKKHNEGNLKRTHIFHIVDFRYRFLIKRHNVASLRHEMRRQRRNNVLLLLIVASYAISWLPFNISYTIFTYASRFQNGTGN